MEKKGNWLVRNIGCISTFIALYPWFCFLLVHLTNNGVAAFLGYLMVSFLLAIANLIISTIIIIIVKKSKPPLKNGATLYFLCMNSISVAWMILMSLIY
ncbi:hypothetical protein [Klebsiella aerogenes]|uniref:hypothetical protein n=1 Tax=Klebsiella aerogenes TaxID=548 RepID=UPI0011608B32|nr:hypothetical protein [Klebsiella aerogenes]MEB7636839.1 hypothetical protein [Klebsiella aerogenes]